MRNHRSHFLLTLVVGTSLLAFTSCGGGGSGGSKSSTQDSRNERTQERQEERQPIEADMDGQYKAKLVTINQQVAGLITGSVTLSREEQQFAAYVRFSGLQPKVLHPQYVHVGGECPTNDENNDGFIDAVEADKAVGKVLIPLDADLSSQDRGSSIWTVADDFGFYHYAETTSYERLMNDLREGDLDPEDDFVKLGPDKNINMARRVVVIYGVAPDTVLPDTVARRGRLANYQNLPIACGVFEKVTEVPGTADNDRDLGELPPGESIGGSSGADDGATVIVGETSGGTTGGESSGGSTGSNEEEEDDDGGFIGGWDLPWENGGTGGATGGERGES